MYREAGTARMISCEGEKLIAADVIRAREAARGTVISIGASFELRDTLFGERGGRGVGGNPGARARGSAPSRSLRDFHFDLTLSLQVVDSNKSSRDQACSTSNVRATTQLDPLINPLFA